MNHNIHLKLIHNQNEAARELKKIGVDKDSAPMMSPKMQYWVLKLIDIDVRAANILKQEMLSKGGEAAVAKWASGFSKPITDAILMGTLKHYRLLLKKMRLQPFGLKAMAVELEAVLKNLNRPKQVIWRCRQGEISIGPNALIMGILNVTPDSFSDPGRYFDPQQAVKHGLSMIASGADIIDIGGESSRPGAEPVSLDEERKRIIPIIKKLREAADIPISIDTQKSRLAQEAIAAGADIVNDISALRYDPEMAGVVAGAKVPLILMHMQGTPKTMQKNPRYDDLIAEICAFFHERMELAESAGVEPKNIALDPGFGFGKTVQHNLEIIRRLQEFKSLGRPILLGTSRKSTIGKVLDLSVEERLEGTAATVTAGVLNGADIVRVHDVKAMVRVVRMADAIKKGIDWHG